MEGELAGDVPVQHVDRGHVDAGATLVPVHGKRQQPFTYPDRQRPNHVSERANRVDRGKIASIQGPFQQLDQRWVELVDGLRQGDAPLHGLEQRGFDLGRRGSAVNEAAS